MMTELLHQKRWSLVEQSGVGWGEGCQTNTSCCLPRESKQTTTLCGFGLKSKPLQPRRGGIHYRPGTQPETLMFFFFFFYFYLQKFRRVNFSTEGVEGRWCFRSLAFAPDRDDDCHNGVLRVCTHQRVSLTETVALHTQKKKKKDGIRSDNVTELWRSPGLGGSLQVCTVTFSGTCTVSPTYMVFLLHLRGLVSVSLPGLLQD